MLSSHVRSRTDGGEPHHPAKLKRRFSHGIHVWYYLDDSDDVFGPYDQKVMRQWLERGYFDSSLRVRSELAAQSTKLNLIPTCSRKKSHLASGEAYVPIAELWPNIEDAFVDRFVQEFEYADYKGSVHGPFPQSHLEYWMDRGMLPVDLQARRVGTTQWQTLEAMFEKKARALEGRNLIIAALADMDDPLKALSPRGERKEKGKPKKQMRRLQSLLRFEMTKRRGSIRFDDDSDDDSDE